MGEAPTYKPTPPGSLIKEELKARKISQKEFAKLMHMRPSHISELLSGVRRITLDFANKVEDILYIPAKLLTDQQNAYDILNPEKNGVSEESVAKAKLAEINEYINVTVLLRPLKHKFKTAVEKIEALTAYFGLNDDFKHRFENMAKGCFRKSTKNGLDERMIATWVLRADASFSDTSVSTAFNMESKDEVCSNIAKIFHENADTMQRLTDTLAQYGIAFKKVDKVDHASIDGYSFYKGCTPCIAVTCRYDRIDNLAFTVMHELGHIYLGHTRPGCSQINIDIRSFNDEVRSKQEKQADDFASETLIPSKYWKLAPNVPVNPFKIQNIYALWAKKNHLNKWIVLGRVSHETGMYKFSSDDTRQISGGKEVCP